MPAQEYYYCPRWERKDIYNHYAFVVEELLKGKITSAKEIDAKLFRRLVRQHTDTITVKDVIAKNREAVIYENPQGTDLPAFSIHFSDNELIYRVRSHDFLVSLWGAMGWLTFEGGGVAG